VVPSGWAMGYDENLVLRIRRLLEKQPGYSEKKMFGGICFLIRGNMACGLADEDLMARVGPERYERALAAPHARPMDFTGRPLTGYVYVSPAGTKSSASLAKWVGWCTEFAATLPTKKKSAKKAAKKKTSKKKA
jgi:TfoX/Sxy family transcriptional regulator of competence genes